MATQLALWTPLANGRETAGEHSGKLRISIFLSPRLTPQSGDEQTLAAFPLFLDWPTTLQGLSFALNVGNQTLHLSSKPVADSSLWSQLFSGQTPVAGFQFEDFSQRNLRSYPVRNILGNLRTHYRYLAAETPDQAPTLLPWSEAATGLKNLLESLGTRVVDVPGATPYVEPGFERLFGDEYNVRNQLDKWVFQSKGAVSGFADSPGIDSQAGQPVKVPVPLRALPPDWEPNPGRKLSAVMGMFKSAGEYSLYQADSFYQRSPPPPHQRYPSFDNDTAPPSIPEFDFHRIVASYAGYPRLLRALGLVVDAYIEDTAQIDALIAAGGGQAHGTMRLTVAGRAGSSGLIQQTPAVAWFADRERFVCRPKSNEHDHGFLNLEQVDDDWNNSDKLNRLFDVYQVDPDGAALKTSGFTRTAQNLLSRSFSKALPDGRVTYTTGNEQAPAALRSGGIGISQHGRALRLAQHAASAAFKQQAFQAGNADSVALFAEDVMRGYRLDVMPVDDALSTGQWYSLCERQGEYRVISTGNVLNLGRDEGYISGAGTTHSTEPNANPADRYVHESLFRWTGWSLSVPLPGLTLKAEEAEDGHLQHEIITRVEEATDRGNNIAATFSVPPRSLPRLRFGQQYRFRARMVDLAGNSIAHDAEFMTPFQHATEPVGYWRFEPVDPPVVVHRHRLSEGESLERMVIRSNFNVTADQYPQTAAFSAATALPESADFRYPAVNERHLLPPKAAHIQCEQHGLFDDYLGNGDNIKQGYAIAARESGSLFDQTETADLELVTPQSVQDTATSLSLPLAAPSASNPVGDRLVGGQYILHKEAQVAIPYLPDPAADGIAIFSLGSHRMPGFNTSDPETILGPSCAIVKDPKENSVLIVTHGGEWPHRQGCRIVLQERNIQYLDENCAEIQTDGDDGLPHWDEVTRVLTLYARKGEIFRFGYASVVDSQRVREFGLMHWAESDFEKDHLYQWATVGRHWMLAPPRKLTLVHATQQPVCVPQLNALTVSRTLGDTHADLISKHIHLHGPSTGKFEIEAQWQEWVDDVNSDGPERRTFTGALGEINLTENHVNEFSLDTAMQAQVYDSTRPRVRQDRHQLGDTRFRLVQYRLCASSRFREYFPPVLFDDKAQVTRTGPVALGPGMSLGAEDDPGAPVLRDSQGANQHSMLLATAPPADPRVLYTVPAVAWSKQAGDGAETISRTGGGIRVWLERPWFSSGDGELLGVVIAANEGALDAVPAAMLHYVSMWGSDPIWATATPKNITKTTDFPLAVSSEPVPLQEFPQASVHVVGHRVYWDAQRKQWYCDIQIRPGNNSYMPFARLALVRYQPNAIGSKLIIPAPVVAGSGLSPVNSELNREVSSELRAGKLKEALTALNVAGSSRPWPSAKISKVVLTEFIQLLPNRRVNVTREANQLAIQVRGAVASAGPMKYSVDNAFLGESPVGTNQEYGRNRFELVLQTRDPALNSDMAWEDDAVLYSDSVAQNLPGARASGTAVAQSGQGIAQAAGRGDVERLVKVLDGELASVAGRTVRAKVDADITISQGLAETLALLDPLIWQAAVDIPQRTRPSRLQLREFERFYSDHTVPDGTVQRRVVEERMVFSTELELT
ncbi:MAG: hypothetical protein VYA55_04125 [Pseudomonadota bacterium]|nr:hypothetical protein [Pseudomonadota bacterium]